MTADSRPWPTSKGIALVPILGAGLLAGTVDILQACILFGWNIPLAIAGGLLGPRAFHGGAATYILGLFLHFLIATSAAAIYYTASPGSASSSSTRSSVDSSTASRSNWSCVSWFYRSPRFTHEVRTHSAT
jgi:hypothetical protein